MLMLAKPKTANKSIQEHSGHQKQKHSPASHSRHATTNTARRSITINRENTTSQQKKWQNGHDFRKSTIAHLLPMLIEDLVDKLPTQYKKDLARYNATLPNVTLKTLSNLLYELAKLLTTVVTPKLSKYDDRKPIKEKVELNASYWIGTR